MKRTVAKEKPCRDDSFSLFLFSLFLSESSSPWNASRSGQDFLKEPGVRAKLSQRDRRTREANDYCPLSATKPACLIDFQELRHPSRFYLLQD